MRKIKPPVPNVINKRNDTAETITKVSYVKDANVDVELTYSNTTAVSNSVYDKIVSNEEILTLFPDVELSIQILVSSILSPNDLMSTKLNYTHPDIDIPSSLNTHVLDVIRTHIDKNYNIEAKLSTILREALFTKGAYAEAIIPDTNVLELQKLAASGLSTESMVSSTINNNKTLSKYLVSPNDTKLSLESNSGTNTNIDINDAALSVSFTEDISILMSSDIYLSELATENSSVVAYRKPTFKSYMKKKKETSSVVTIKTDNSSGSPLVVKLPVGSVLPIHITSDPSKHVGYLVVLDENGIPVTGTIKQGKLTDADMPSARGMDGKASIIKKAADALKSKLKDDELINNVDSIYTKALIARISDKINTGALGTVASIPDNNDIYHTVFTRALKGLKTRLLFIPKENLSYFAFEYRDNGTGKSLLEKSVMLFSIRAANLFTRIMANIKNSVTTTKVSASLDDNDPDPERTREMIINEAMKSERVKYPVGVTNVTDLVDWMHNVGYRFDISHPRLPDITIDVADENRNVAEPDDRFDEMIQEHIIMSFGLKKDMVMSGYDADFATTVVANNALFAKRVMDHQNVFNPQISDHIRKLLLNDGLLKGKIIDILIANIRQVRKLVKKGLSTSEYEEYKSSIDSDDELTDYIYGEYCNNISIALPKVDISSEDGSMDGLDAFTDMLDNYLPMIISSETLPVELVGDISDKMDGIMGAIKTMLIRKWMDDRNVLPEISKFLTLDNTGKPRYDILGEYTDFTKTLAGAILPHLKILKRSANKLDNTLDKIDGDSSHPETAPVEDDSTLDTVTSVGNTDKDELPSEDNIPVDDTTTENDETITDEPI